MGFEGLFLYLLVSAVAIAFIFNFGRKVTSERVKRKTYSKKNLLYTGVGIVVLIVVNLLVGQ